MSGLRVAGFVLVALLVAPRRGVAEPRVAVGMPGTIVAGDRAVLVPAAGARGDGLLRATVLLEHAEQPLALITTAQERREVVSRQSWLHLAASFSFRHRWLVSAHVPLLLTQSGDARGFGAELPAAGDGLALGDPRLSLRGRVLGDADGVALGMGVRAALPLATTAYAGGPGPQLASFAALGSDGVRASWSTSLGLSWQKSLALPGILPTRSGPALELGVAARFALDGAARAHLGPELLAASTIGGGARLADARSTLCQLLLRLQLRPVSAPIEIGLAGGPTLGRAAGAADYRALLSLTFSPEAPVPPPDGDGDRVADAEDMCPSLSGVASEDPVMNGCPPLPSDADGDGIPDTLDACPRTPGEPSVTKARHGCPLPPLSSGPAPASPQPTATLEPTQITISEQVKFATGTAILDPSSAAVLGRVAALLQEHPEIEALEVAGHTDDTGSTDLNRDLSLARAQAVVGWLVEQGVDARRLSAQGYGATRPLAPNDSDAGRARNRRVELIITRRTPAPEAP